jgi:hypothetical protein
MGKCPHERRRGDECPQCSGIIVIAKKMRRDAKRRSIKFNVPFDMTVEDILAVFGNRCPVFGTLFSFEGTDWSPTLDRFEGSLGYVRGNVCVISRLANQMKSSGDPEQARMIASWMAQRSTKFEYYECTYVSRSGESFEDLVAQLKSQEKSE